MRIAIFAATTAMLLSSGAALAAQTPIQFNLINIGGVDPGTNAFKGFHAAADYWSSILTTSQPVVININVGFQSLGPGILGSTGSSRSIRQVPFVLNRIAARQSTTFDSTVVFPTLHAGEYDALYGGPSALNMYTPGYTGSDIDGVYGINNETKVYDTDGKFNASYIAVNTANAKALGYTFGDNIDAQIQFSSDFKFDFNPRNGIMAGTSDFYAVAIHEIGHALGFVSGVDDYDFLGTGGPCGPIDCLGTGEPSQDYRAQEDWWGSTLDLFRYSEAGRLDWTTDTASYFSVDGGATAYQNGLFSTATYNGDGWQASHWKAPQVIDPDTGELVFSCARPKLGIMNPYICGGRPGVLTGLDLAAFDAIGYNTNADLLSYNKTTAQIAFDLTNVPEPSSWAMLIAGFGLTGAAMRRRRQGAAIA